MQTVVFAYDRRSTHCRLVESFLGAALRRHGGEAVRVIRLEWGEQPAAAAELGVTDVPHVLVLEDGRLVARLDRPASSASLDAFIRRCLASGASGPSRPAAVGSRAATRAPARPVLAGR